MEKINDLLWTNPDDLLEDDRALLEEDFEKLGSLMVTNREFWVASMEAVILTAEHKQRKDDITTDNGNSEDHVLHDPEFDDKGSLWYQKRQQKWLKQVRQ